MTMGPLAAAKGRDGLSPLAVGGSLQSYIDKVKATGPIAYWPQNEPSGGTAIDQILSPQQDGAYSNVTLGQPGIGDGNTAAGYNGIIGVGKSFCNVFTPTLQGRVDMNTGSLMSWGQADNAGVWTDGQLRFLARVEVNGANFVDIFRPAANNRITVRRRGAGANKFVNIIVSSLTWMQFVITWDTVADEVIVYFNGVQTGAIQNGLAVIAGNISVATFGNNSPAAFNTWFGNNAHPALWDQVLTPAEVANLYIIP